MKRPKKINWIKGDFNFTHAFASLEMDEITACKVRQEVTHLGINRRKRFQNIDAFDILSSHQIGGEFNVESSDAKDVCMHATNANPAQTVNSMVIQIDGLSKPELWATASSNPCLSLFKPLYFGNDDADFIGTPGPTFDSSFWWTIERFHRLALNDYQSVKQYIQDNIVREYESLIDYRAGTTSEITRKAFSFHRKAAEEGFNQLSKSIRKRFFFFSMYGSYWKKQNQKAQLAESK